jgi:hypothetical protein
MARSMPGEADRQLIMYAARQGVDVTARNLERWRESGLLAPNARRALGRGRGSTSVPPPGGGDLVVWLAKNARRGRRPSDLALQAFAGGLAVPENIVRASFARAIAAIRLPGEANMAPGADPDDAADAAVAIGLRLTMVPSRVKRIDRGLAKLGINWSPPQLAAIDPGHSDLRLDSSSFLHTAVRVILGGGAGIDMATIGALARAMAPVGGVAPLAGQVEYRWPISPRDERDSAPDDDDVLALLGSGDIREQARELAGTTPLEDLRDAFQLAAELRRWADKACTAVEREIAAGQPGEAAKEWITSAFGVTRVLLIMAIHDKDPRPGSTATTALLLIMMRNMIKTVCQLVPTSYTDVLNNPFVAPSFLVDFLTH